MKYKYFIFLLFIILTVNCFGMGFKSIYIPIDSLNKSALNARINLDLIDNKIILILEGKEYKFIQSYKIDTLGHFHSENLVSEQPDQRILLKVNRLINFSSDSIFITFGLNIHFKNSDQEIKTEKNNKMSISRHSLKGLNIGPTKGQERSFLIFWGVLSVLSIWLMAATN